MTSYEERTVTSERVTEAQGYESDDVANPVAPNLELTGQEYGQARQAAAALFDRLGPTFTIEDVLVAGSVSDDFGGKIGQPNPEQQKLADARAEVAARAFQDEAAARGIVLPKEPVKIGTEKVVMPELEAQIIQVLEQHKLDLPTAISRYNRGDALPQDVRELLDSAIGGSNRGAAYEVSGTKQVTEQVAVTEWVEDTEDQIFKDIPGEGVFVFGALPGLIYGGLFGIMSSKARQTRRRARRIAKRAGLAL